VYFELAQGEFATGFSVGLEVSTFLLNCLRRCRLDRSCGLTASIVCLLLRSGRLLGVLGSRLLLLLSNAAMKHLLALKGSAQLPLQLENLLSLCSNLSSGRLWRCLLVLNTSCRCCFPNSARSAGVTDYQSLSTSGRSSASFGSIFLDTVGVAINFGH